MGEGVSPFLVAFRGKKKNKAHKVLLIRMEVRVPRNAECPRCTPLLRKRPYLVSVEWLVTGTGLCVQDLVAAIRSPSPFTLCSMSCSECSVSQQHFICFCLGSAEPLHIPEPDPGLFLWLKVVRICSYLEQQDLHHYFVFLGCQREGQDAERAWAGDAAGDLWEVRSRARNQSWVFAYTRTLISLNHMQVLPVLIDAL